MSPSQNRRQFVRTLGMAGAAAILSPAFSRASEASSSELEVHIFSKHLQFLDYRKMAEAAAKMGFDGVDLTVRPNGHVLPENATKDLPLAIAEIQAAGLKHEIMTTAVKDARDPIDSNLLRVATDQGIERYRMNWFRYSDSINLPDQLNTFSETVRELSDLNESLDLIGCYQNHAGTFVGASIWEVWKLIESANPKHFGIQYDIRHATVEGGLSWQTGFKLAAPRIRSLAVKDFKWIEKDGRNQLVNTPIGEGTVDWLKYFGQLKKSNIKVPISLHLEYDLGGAQWGRREIEIAPEAVYEAMSKDLAAIRSLWAKA